MLPIKMQNLQLVLKRFLYQIEIGSKINMLVGKRGRTLSHEGLVLMSFGSFTNGLA